MDIYRRGVKFYWVSILALFIFLSGCEGGGDHKVECIDRDHDGYCQFFAPGPDCDDNDPFNWHSCQTCADLDHDGYRGAGCDRAEDCDDNNSNVWSDCGNCVDNDGDGSFVGCQNYNSVQGPDCDDDDRDNWVSCATCTDADGDGQKGTGCDNSQDCNDQEPLLWSNCGLDTVISSYPPEQTNSPDAGFTFVCNSQPCTFKCQIDSGAWQDCSSPQSYSGLSDGSHFFEVYAIDSSGNSDPTPAFFSWLIDTTPPDTIIDGNPPLTSHSTNAGFAFHCTEEPCTFECNLDSGGWSSCSSPEDYSGLSEGSHTFQVAARDAFGNLDLSPASHAWSIVIHDYWVENTILRKIPDPREDYTAVWTGTEMIIWGGHSGSYLNTGGKYNPSTDSWAPTSTWTNVPAARACHSAVWTGNEMIVWGGFYHEGWQNQYLNTGGKYNPFTDSWTEITIDNAPSERYNHTAVWTGNEMIIWGGLIYDYNIGRGHYFNTGAKYDPATDSWTQTSTTGAPLARHRHVAVWTGNEMIVWGGDNGAWLSAGGKYNPSTDSWKTTSTSDEPSARSWHSAVWTGNEMIIWGGWNNLSLNTGGKYNPSMDSWMPTSTGANAPSARCRHSAVWTGNEMIIWGGHDVYEVNTGGKYNPYTDFWTPTSTGTNVPSARYGHTAIWTGTEMIVWGGKGSIFLHNGGRYNPSLDSWTPTYDINIPAGRSGHTAVWTGTEMIIWGGMAGYQNKLGARYDPVSDSWTSISEANAPRARYSHNAVWTGNEMIVWGGYLSIYGPALGDGGRYNPATDSWIAISNAGAPGARWTFSAVWTGTEMIVWGGCPLSNTGGRYNPENDFWTSTSLTNTPSARHDQTSVWTGTEMIVWGGLPGGCGLSGPPRPLNTGGRYDPSGDLWVATSLTNAPSPRYSHTAIWTGTEMILWGGYTAFDTYTETGGKYDPSTDSWAATSTRNAPVERSGHSAVWTGAVMIVWGGNYIYKSLNPALSINETYNTGSRYDPLNNSWAATTLLDAPSARYAHTAVWTGTEMIVWGGRPTTNTGGRYFP